MLTWYMSQPHRVQQEHDRLFNIHTRTIEFKEENILVNDLRATIIYYTAIHLKM